MSKKESTQSKLLTVSEAVSSRHTCRKFLSKDVPIDLIIKILNESRRSPSGSNLQPWKIYVIHGETKTQLTTIIQNKFNGGQMGDMPLQYQLLPGVEHIADLSYFKNNFPKYKARHSAMGRAIYSAQGIKRGDMEGRMKHINENWEFFGAPIGLLFTIDKRMGVAQYPDLGILLGTIMLLCEQYGLATCCQGAWSLWHKSLRQIFDISNKELIYCGMCIGYENKESKVNQIRSDRMSLDELMVMAKISDNVNVNDAVSKMDVYVTKGRIMWIVFKGSRFFNLFVLGMLVLFIWLLMRFEWNIC